MLYYSSQSDTKKVLLFFCILFSSSNFRYKNFQLNLLLFDRFEQQLINFLTSSLLQLSTYKFLLSQDDYKQALFYTCSRTSPVILRLFRIPTEINAQKLSHTSMSLALILLLQEGASILTCTNHIILNYFHSC